MSIDEPSDQTEYRPETIPRRGESVAWIKALISLSGWLVLVSFGLPVHASLMFFAVFFAIAAMAISLGNWIDRQTRLHLGPEGVLFENGLRKTYLLWEDIQRVEVFPTSLGKKVRVLGAEAHFEFRTLGEVFLKGQIKGRLGFEKGDQILDQILERAHLKVVGRTEQGYDIYSRS